MSEHGDMFKATLAKVEDNRAHVDIEVDSKEVDQALDRAYRRVAKKVVIPGFRKGRAPRAILQRHIGKGSIYEEALDDLIPHAYAHAVSSTGIEPIDQPEINGVKFNEGEPLLFSVKVEVKPAVNVGDYRSVQVERPAVAVTAEDIDKNLAHIQQQNIRQVVADADVGAADGHHVIIDYTTSVAGETIAEAKDEDLALQLGSGRYLPEFEQGLVGMKTGETRDLQIPFPEDYPQPQLAGQTAVMSVTIKEIKQEEVPPIDDDLAAAVGLESLAELRADIETNLLARANHEADHQFRNAVVRAVTEQAEIEVPETLIHRTADSRREDMERRLEDAGLTLAQYLADQEETEEEFDAELYREAAERVRIDLVMEAVAKLEELTITEEDLQQEALTMSQTYHQPVEEMRRFIDRAEVRDQIEGAILRRKAIDLLVELASMEKAAE